LLRLNKKGITHVDWAISMGIFIIYVSFLIIFILPGLLKTQFDPSILFDSFEKNFLKPLEWTVVKIPLIVVNLKNSIDVGASTQSVRLVFEIPTNSDYRFTKVEPVSSTKLQTFDEGDNPKGNFDADGKVGLEFTNDLNKIKMILGCIPLDCNDIPLKFSVAPLNTKKSPEFEITCNVDDENACKASLGIEEEIKGIKEKPFLSPDGNSPKESSSFKDYKDGNFLGYSTLKTENLKFSDNFNFNIWYQEYSDGTGTFGSKESIFDPSVFTNAEQMPPTVPDNADVFIKEFKRFYVNELGDVKPVVFYFETW